MLKKLIIGLYLSSAIFLMNFSTKELPISYTESNTQNETTEVTWLMLGRMGGSLQVMPNYGDIIKESMQGKHIKISGFIIPVDSKSYVLSKNVFSHCFFCSTAGIETIMGIQFKGKIPRLKTDTFVTLEGNFYYNDKDKNDWLFYIKDTFIKTKK